MKQNSKRQANALIKESSPYLLQHAYNPVNWLPWNKETRAKAERENKPMLVSIGYSSCHWCHVMERESFENDEVAQIMNEYFVCVKVDREERPDVDQVYMEAVQMMSRQGGWPLNCFTTPDGKPIYGGTYFPVGQWKKILLQIAELWKSDPKKVNEYGNNLVSGMQVNGSLPIEIETGDDAVDVLRNSIQNWATRFDREYGGPNKAPKFPLPCNLFFLMHYAKHSGDEGIRNHLTLTLDNMAFGGIYDQIGGGFTRYSTDKYWKVPHFEKMLYDNGQLLGLYAEAYAFTKNETYLEITRSIKSWLEREMKDPSGMYYSAIDADSEGEEGKFYVWTEEEIDRVGRKRYAEYYHLDQNALWEGKYIPVSKGKPKSYQDLRALNSDLLKLRSNKVRPITDDKQLCSWNAMLATGFFKSYRFTDSEEDLAKGIEVLDFILSHLFDEDSGKLFHSWKAGHHSAFGFLEDYAFTIEALIEAYQTEFNENLLIRAKDLCLIALDKFYDSEKGIFFFTEVDQDDLVNRPMEMSDNVIPSSNGVMAHNLRKLSSYFDLAQFENNSERLLNGVKKGMIEYAEGYAHWADLLLSKTLGYPEIVTAGDEAIKLFKKLNELYTPGAVYGAVAGNTNIPLLKNRFKDGLSLGYICRGKACLKPSSDLIELIQEIDGLSLPFHDKKSN